MSSTCDFIPQRDQFRKNRIVLIGLFLGVLTILFGQGLGIIFGLNEDGIKDRLRNSSFEVRDSVYKGDDAAIKVVLDKSWSYMKRAHLHAGGMGTTAVVLIIVMMLLRAPCVLASFSSLGLGCGGLGYSLFWMWAGFRAPALGSTGLAKESLRWLAIPSSGVFVLATVVVLGLVLLQTTLPRLRE